MIKHYLNPLDYLSSRHSNTVQLKRLGNEVVSNDDKDSLFKEFMKATREITENKNKEFNGLVND